MAQSLISFICFNDNSASTVKDFSTNKNHSSSVTDLVVESFDGATGKVGKFNASSTDVDFGTVNGLNALTKLSICVRFRLSDVGARGIISWRDANHILEVTAADKLKITIQAGASYILTDTRTLVAGVWYTAMITWNGTTGDLKIYVDGIDSPASTTGATGTTPTNSNSLILGNNTGDYFNGRVEMISYYSKEFNEDEVLALAESPTGIKFVSLDGYLQTGDLILNSAGGQEVVTWYEEFDERLFSDLEEHNFNDTELIIFKN